MNNDHGGKREGAGRKPKRPEQRKVKIGVPFDPDLIEWIEGQQKEGEKFGTAVNRLLCQLRDTNLSRSTARKSPLDI